MILMKSTTSPTLSSGAFTQAFGEFEKVNQAMAFIDTPDGAAAGKTLALKTVISDNNVAVTITMVDLTTASDVARVWANAVDGDVTGMTVTVVAEGE